MQAFQNVRAEMRESAHALTHPGGPPKPAGVARLARGKPAQQDEPDDDCAFIEPWMVAAFQALTHASEEDSRFGLISCLMNGEPAVIIAHATPIGRRIHLTPLFVACQRWMKFTSAGEAGEEDEEGEEEEEGGGPDRSDEPSPS